MSLLQDSHETATVITIFAKQVDIFSVTQI